MNQPASANATLVSVCIATCRRPEGLRRLLNALIRLRFTHSTNTSLEVIVVDNDAHCSAKQVFDDLVQQSALNIHYIVERKSGIPFARNAALRFASAESQYIAFIDDDETPEENWLDELLRTQQLYGADVVAGPVLPMFEKGVPKWIVDGKFFDRPRFPTGKVLAVAATNNALIRAEIIKSLDLWFDETWALTGGSDTQLFLTAHAKGAKIVWADNALVHELVPLHRAKVSWILARTWQGSINFARAETDVSRSIAWKFTKASKGLLRIGLGVLMAPFVVIGGNYLALKALQNVVMGLGTLAGILGIRYQGYKYLHMKE